MEREQDNYSGLFYPAAALITEKGIKYEDKYYSCHEAIRKQWFHPSSVKRILTVFIDSLNDDYLLIQLEDGCLIVALRVEYYRINSIQKLNDYYKLVNSLKKIIKERKGEE
ncbi:hypothetical protein [Paenibacillus tyrfis]|uniref:hypothetical protein n=1 Tax=Paenibacillus tyrfis TaxID=1501230 RepID=UPI000B58E10F|nr:hypothetical protein [Paenibacillus tyrfis]